MLSEAFADKDDGYDTRGQYDDTPADSPWCKECDLFFKNLRGLAIHNGRVHSES